MFEAKFRLKHKGCWSNGLRRFKSRFVTHNTISLDGGFVQDITEVILADKKEAAPIKKYFLSNKLIKKVEILQESPERLLIQVFTNTSDIKSIVHTVLKHKCFVFNKVPLVQGYEVWTIAAPRKSAIRKALEEVSTFGDFKLVHVKKSTFDGFNLSAMQDKVLQMALDLGYYKWPRKISLSGLAKKLSLSKVTVAEHLRKAEIKVMSREFCK